MDFQEIKEAKVIEVFQVLILEDLKETWAYQVHQVYQAKKVHVVTRENQV